MKDVKFLSFPCSYGQRQLKLHAQLFPSSTSYNLNLLLEFISPADIDLLHQAVEIMVARHEVLRTTYAEEKNEFIQQIHSYLPLAFEVIDATNITEGELSTALNLRIFQPYNLENDSPIRLHFFTTPNSTIFLLCMHHIAWDAWSHRIFFSELSTIYSALAAKKTINLPPLSKQYRDLAVWQLGFAKSPAGQFQKKYWENLLKDMHPLELVSLKNSTGPTGGDEIYFRLDSGALKKINDIAKNINPSATLHVYFLTAYLAFLNRYTGVDDLAINLPQSGRLRVSAGRAREDFSENLGYFVNPSIFRISISSQQTFTSLLQQVQELTENNRKNQDYPLLLLLEEMQLKMPKVSFNYIKKRPDDKDNIPISYSNHRVEIDGLPPFVMKSLPSQTDLSDFHFEVTEGKEEAFFTFKFKTDVLCRAQVERFIMHFRVLLNGIEEHPNQKICNLPLLTEEEKNQILYEWNQTETDYPQDKTIHQLFEEQVERTPDNIAVIFENQQLTYRELNERANQLARYLQRMGVQAETLVGISLDRGVDVMVGILGVLKASGAYVPLDPEYPEERLAYMVEDTQTPIILTTEKYSDNFRRFNRKLVCLDQDWQDQIAKEEKENLEPQAGPSNLAYVIYTSGSTGKPKGVMVEHRGLSNLALMQSAAFYVEEDSRVLQFASMNFDAMVSEWAITLTKGAAFYFVRSQRELVGDSLVKICNHYRISLMTIPPSILATILPEEVSSLQTIVVAGEASSRELLEKWHKKVKVINAYGPTESTVCASLIEYDGNYSANTIGKPLSNTQLYILDSTQQPVPIGVMGELYIGGVALARGYLNRDDLTKEKFIQTAFGRLYRTGDLARYLPDGNIEYVGRSDHQVKIRGFRIECGEIESILREGDEIKEAIVIAREDEPGEKRLVTYVVPKNDTKEESVLIGKIKSKLSRRLSWYMVPSAFVVLDKMPLNLNGKVDRKALPAPNKVYSTKQYVAPSTEIELQLVKLCSELLKIEESQISTEEDFFSGDSLLATRLRSRLQKAFSIEFPLRDIFDCRTVKALAKEVEHFQHGQGIIQSAILSLVRQERPLQIPLSFAQQRIWFLEQLLPNNALYNMPLALKLRGEINITALEVAFQALIARHEVLRTQFMTNAQGMAEQVIQPVESCAFAIRQKVLESKDKIAELTRIESLTPFDLQKGPLVRVTLLQQNEHEFLLLMTIHHAISDGWSMGILMKELSAYYNHYACDAELSLDPLPIQYADFSLWQRQWLQGEKLTQQLAYWQKELKGIPEEISLPTRPRTKESTYVGSMHETTLSADLGKGLKKLADEHNATLYMVLLASFNVLLYRYTQQETIVIGSPIANRHHREVEGLIGFFVNTLALRTDIKGEMSFTELLAQVRERTLGGDQHQDLPFEQLVDHLQIARQLNRNPVFQVMFVLQNAQQENLNLTNIEVEPIEVNYPVAKFDLTLIAIEQADGLIKLGWEYSTDLFKAQTIERMSNHFVELIKGIVAVPQQRVGELPLLTEEERKQILLDWNQTEADYPKDKTIHQLFEEQVNKTPENIAVVFEEKTLTYRELNERANQLAHYLQRMGVATETLVGIAVDRGVEVIVGMLGVLKAGGAYVPLDPEYPEERLAYMIEDTKMPLILTIEKYSPNLKRFNRRLICLDKEWQEQVAKEKKENLETQAGPSNLAYVIYTSGSTGKPKGVLIEHHSLVCRISNLVNYYGLNETDRVLQHASYNFDASYEEIIMPIVCGARSVVIPEDSKLFPSDVESFIEKHQISYITMTPSHFEALVHPEFKLTTVKRLVLGGDILRVETARRIAKEYPHIQLCNVYGPTETTIDATFFQFSPGNDITNVSIGQAFWNTKIYILDSRLNPVPAGVQGELYIGGPGLARGYLNRVELTQEKFLTTTFGRLYRTGDLARYLPDGNIEYLGRIDHQVKIRGFRIECGEIESVLREVEEVKDVLVIAREDEMKPMRLVAYIAVREVKEETRFVEDVREKLSQRLPEYMVPSAFVVLENFPLTPNGKVDRKALPAPNKVYSTKQYVAPSTEIEGQLVKLWSEVLKIEESQISTEEDFFTLGGHSLLATQLRSRLQNAFSIEFPLRAIFDCRTVKAIAKQVEHLQHTRGNVHSAIPPLISQQRPLQIPLSFAQQRLWFLEQLLPNTALYNIPVAFRLQGSLNREALEKAFKSIIDRHESLRTRLVLNASGSAEQIVVPVNEYHFSIDQPKVGDIKVLAREESLKPFDLQNAPLLRVNVLNDDRKSVLLICLHHVVSDGWSMEILAKEISEFYNHYAQGTPITLAPLAIQYADYALWQRSWLQGELLNEQLKYWQKKLADIPEELNLPMDRARPKILSYAGKMHAVVLPRELCIQLRALSQNHQASLFMILLASFNVLLYRYTHQETIVVGSPIANRHYKEVEGLIGFFVNTLALRADLKSDINLMT